MHRAQVIWLDQTLEDQKWSSKTWQESWDDFTHFIIQCLIEEDRLISFALWTLAPHEDVLHLLKIAVHPDKRRHGFAQILFDEMLKAYPSKGVYLEVKANNSTAVSFYQKVGLRIMTRTRNYYGQGEDAYKMFKPALPNT